MTEEQITFLVQWRNIIPIARKYQTYKEYPLDLFHKEFIIALRMNDNGFYQIQDGEKKWLLYAW